MAPDSITNMAVVTAHFRRIITADMISVSALLDVMLALGVHLYTINLETSQLSFETLPPDPNGTFALLKSTLSLAAAFPVSSLSAVARFLNPRSINDIVDPIRREGTANFLGFVSSLRRAGVKAVTITPMDGHYERSAVKPRGSPHSPPTWTEVVPVIGGGRQ
ncbi:hypothetical protein QBC38DRAFT_458632 [Podospora fimiseda]|uniref:Uncharacterized protein n=1 Tax=Podospora fimiseda TaxID=252190 RepID=A0AAN7GZF3_9PEZI|nr:hypothetical protein QBC38DRAFT_458632 [Podospora fimiseda]